MLETQTRFLAASTDPQALALYDPQAGVWLSYGQLAERVDALRAELARYPRGLAMLYCRNDAGSLIAYLAAVEAGHAVALLDAAARLEVRQRLQALYQPELVLDAGPGEPTEGLRRVGMCEVHLFEGMNRAATGLHPDLAVLLTTSGSTGSPKLVRLSRRNVESNARAIASYLGLGPGERAVTSLPMPYAYGLSVLNSHLAAGAAIALCEQSVLTRAFWEAFSRAEGSSFAGVPYTYQLLDRIGFERFVPPSLRTMTQAGGKLEPALIAKFDGLMRARGGRFIPMYGQTEATARIAYLPSEEVARRPGSVGRSVPGGRLSLERDGRPVEAPYAPGEVIYRGPNVMMGYAEARADLSRGDELAGRLATGDLGYFDDQGYLFLTGRLTRFAKLYGMRISLDEVESLARAAGPAAAVDLGDRLGIFCEGLSPEALGALGRSLASRLKLPPAALVLTAVEALPVKPSGKIDYARLQELAA